MKVEKVHKSGREVVSRNIEGKKRRNSFSTKEQVTSFQHCRNTCNQKSNKDKMKRKDSLVSWRGVVLKKELEVLVKRKENEQNEGVRISWKQATSSWLVCFCTLGVHFFPSLFLFCRFYFTPCFLSPLSVSLYPFLGDGHQKELFSTEREDKCITFWIHSFHTNCRGRYVKKRDGKCIMMGIRRWWWSERRKWEFGKVSSVSSRSILTYFWSVIEEGKVQLVSE